ncbi:hypothetical protein FUA23_16270 [Neolewinella aurantiaca]|uniref:Chemotaxis methyl-accepting receptor HlyB-like 4HB MCP domain-containing protein n=1 Tax=Neolewinella aurantiaca TaxID=2602767 RepID=A0A5C7FQ02_9BACT|nr:MCP four helix bundle domain-containing protein [Neolewinella aurantiaca]TXF88037.1 hypothetical protein FUA23_16270 [Neolewinella aurantiaca]
MKWAYSIQQKIKAAGLLAAICFLVIGTSFLGRSHMDSLSDSFSSVYEDRLVVESYIYMISDHLYQKKAALDHCTEFADADFRTDLGAHNTAINELLSNYDKTVLTEDEAAFLQDFKANILALHELEVEYLRFSDGEPELVAIRESLNHQFHLAAANLRQLSDIQIKEGKILNDRSQQIVKGSSLITSLELVILICIAIILQVIVLASRPVIARTWQQGNLN